MAARPVDDVGMIGQAMQTTEAAKSDPRRLRALMDRAFGLMREHRIGSVFIGIAGPEGDLLIPELVAFLESQLRVEDGIFVLTRERAVLLLTDVDLEQAKQVVSRICDDFRSRFPTAGDLPVSIRFYAVRAGGKQPTAKVILPKLFGGSLPH
jgi:sulfite reductase beta subunit-like hemoprotein